jgi:hypothetical protein
LKQLEHICQLLSVPVILPQPLHARHGWFSGFFDAEGAVVLSRYGSQGRPQLQIAVSQLLRIDLVPFETFFGGAIYYLRRGNGFYQWQMGSREAILSLLTYFHHCPSRTSKKNRLLLIPSYYDLMDLRAWKLDPLTQQPTKPWHYFWLKWTRSTE